MQESQNVKKYGLLGEHLSHSRSPQIHALLSDYEYRLYPTPKEDVSSFLTSGSFDGLNVTIPYKETVIPFCQHLSEIARRVGSVNTMVRAKDGSFMGDNTDYYGFRYLLSHHFPKLNGKKALVLGSGGSSKTVRVALADAGCREVIIISRGGEDNYSNLSRHYDADFIVNTTPVGMYPNNGLAPISLKPFSSLMGVVDLIYNPIRTALLLEAEALGIPYINGLGMLVAQAAQSSFLFTGIPVDEAKIESIMTELIASETNLVLIGMPGCGKSTLGSRLASALNREFVDTDDFIMTRTGRTPEQIILEDSEAAFRSIETKILTEVGATNGKVIATGGGIVTRAENAPPLLQNGVIIFLHRDPSVLPRDGRPLSTSAEAVMRLYEHRLPLYRQFCDYELNAQDTVDATFDLLLELVRSVFPGLPL